MNSFAVIGGRTLPQWGWAVIVCCAALLCIQPGRAAEPSGDGSSIAPPWRWTKLAPLPDDIGFAGSFAGVHNGALIVAGGANFPAGMPRQEGAKAWHDEAFVLERADSSWTRGFKLPSRVGYGVSVSTEDGVACLGGGDGERHTADCFLLRWENGKVTRTALPSLPEPCANACGTLLGKTIYIAGGSSSPAATTALRTFWALDLSDPQAAWVEREAWPGPGRILAVAGVQGGSFYLFSGAALQADANGAPVREWRTDAYRYTPGKGWRQVADLPRATVAAPSPAPPLGQSHLMVLGGDDGAHADRPPENHAGFSHRMLAYHTITNTWTDAGALPFSLVTTPALEWAGRTIVPGGEMKPGVRSAGVWAGTLTSRRASFGWLDTATLLAYPACMLAIGWVCSRRQKNSADYFKASGRIPWWAAGLSIYATMLSSLTFMAVPAKAYVSDWGFALSYVTLVLLAPLVIHLYLPFFRRLNVTSAYEYLELRFNLLIRLFGSASFIAFQIGRTGIVLYLPALALSMVSDLDMRWCIVGMTMLCIALTVFGGMRAVIWTDVAQSILLLSAVAVSFVFLVLHVDGGLAGVVKTAHAHGKFFEDLSWSGDLTLTTGWLTLIGLGFNNFISYTSNQEVVQRYLTTQDTRLAARAVWTNALISLPSGILFFGVGTALFAFYRQHPHRLDPTIHNDAIFPLFILQELPAGVAGIVVAGIFAAAQPTSGLNSTAAAAVTDFYRRLKSGVSDREALVAGRIATVATGLAGMSVALLAVEMNIRSIWELFLNVLGVSTGMLAGVFALGILTKRSNAGGALLGLLAAATTMALINALAPIHPLWFGAVGVVSSFAYGYLFSHLFPASDLDGLTIWTIDARQNTSGPAYTATRESLAPITGG